MKHIIYGINAVASALEGKRRKVNKLYYSTYKKEIIELAKSQGIKVVEKSFNELNTMTKGEKHQGILLDVEAFNYSSLDEVLASKPKGKHHFIVMLDQIEDPHNFGAIVRTAEAAGVDAILIGANRQVHVTPAVVKVSTGATELMPIVKVSNLNNAIRTLKKNNIWIASADMNGQDYNKVDFDMPICLVVGSEGKGISELVRKNSDFVISLPMYGKITSLNASVSAGILIYKIKSHL